MCNIKFKLGSLSDFFRMHKTPPRTPADFMKIPSHIGPNGLSPVKYEDSESEHDSDPIELATPPKVIKLDDSNIWVNIKNAYKNAYLYITLA